LAGRIHALGIARRRKQHRRASLRWIARLSGSRAASIWARFRAVAKMRAANGASAVDFSRPSARFASGSPAQAQNARAQGGKKGRRLDACDIMVNDLAGAGRANSRA
jgi:hypothetical protein